ncbi:MAG: hypothetical protein KBT06_04390 [Prevotellaceae bacterium]|nr:hypothetical protein [Candidatus Colivivens equi]
MSQDEILLKISHALDLSDYDFEMLTHDVNNLRGGEWLDQVKEIGDKELLKAYRQLIKQ